MLMPSGSPLTLFLCPSPLLLHTPPCSRSQVTLRLCGFYTHTHACTQAHTYTHTHTTRMWHLRVRRLLWGNGRRVRGGLGRDRTCLPRQAPFLWAHRLHSQLPRWLGVAT